MSHRRHAKLVIVTATAVALTACGGPSTQAVHGQVLGGTQSAAAVIAAMGADFTICGGAVAGTRVIVKGPSGTMLATTTLRKAAHLASPDGLPTSLKRRGQVGVYEFSTAIPVGNGPYTIELVGVSRSVVPPKQLGDLLLTCEW
jgi:hypothetical protein